MRLAAADPSNTQWQRDLSVSHNKLGDLAVAAGDLTAARTAYQAGLDHPYAAGRRRPQQHRVAARPVGQPQQARRPRGRGRGPDRGPHRLPGRPRHPYAAGRRRPQQHPVAARPVGQPRQARRPRGRGRGPDRGPHRLPGRPRHPRGWPPPTPATPSGSATCRSATNKLGDLAVAAGDLTAARTAYQAGLDIATRLAAADPSNTQWQRDLSISHNKLGDLDGPGPDPVTEESAADDEPRETEPGGS